MIYIVNIFILYNIIVLKPFILFNMIYNNVTMSITMTDVADVTVTCDVTL